MLHIDIVSDFICPWCFIGTRRLHAAVAGLRADNPDFAPTTRWRPFFLNPDTPPAGEPYIPFLERKFGGRSAVEALFRRVREAGQADGTDFAFEKIALRANTLRAHRLLDWAQRQGNADALADRLFIAQFQRGEAIGEVEVLARIATECGFSGEAFVAHLAAGDGEHELLAAEARIRATGIDGVPTFIFNGRQAVVGAQPTDVLAAAMLQAIGNASPAGLG